MGRSTTSPAPNRGHTHSEVLRLTFVALATCKKGGALSISGVDVPCTRVGYIFKIPKLHAFRPLDSSAVGRITRRCHSGCNRWNDRTGGRMELFLSAQQTPHQHS